MIRTFSLLILLVLIYQPFLAQNSDSSMEAEPAIEVGAETIIAIDGTGKNSRGTPYVAFGNNYYLCAWREGWEGRNGGARIHAVRIDTDGNIIDTKPIEISPNKSKDAPQEHPKIAFCKNIFLVVWQDLRNEKDYDVLAARITIAGRILDTNPIMIAGGPHNQVLPDVASDDKGFMVVWQGFQENDRMFHGYASRIDLRGKVGKPVETGIAPQQKIAWDAKAFLISCDGGKGTGARKTSNTATAIRLGQDSRLIGKSFAVAELVPNGYYSLSSVPGKGWLFVTHRSPPDAWAWGGTGAMMCYFILSEGGVDISMNKENQKVKSNLQPNWIDVNTSDREVWPYGTSASAWDGKQSVVVWQRYQCMGEKKSTLTNCDIMAAQTDGWKRLTEQPISVATTDSEELAPALASNSDGKLLCIYEKELNGETLICMRILKSK
jgi:hypothetical protein